MPTNKKRTTATQEAFLTALAKVGNVSAAAKMAGVTRQATYRWRKDDEFKVRWDEAIDEAIEGLEFELLKRATQGKKPSDVLLMFALKGLKPEKYRDNHTHRIQGHDGGGLVVQIVEKKKNKKD